MMMRSAVAVTGMLLCVGTITACVDTPQPGGVAQCCQADADCVDGYLCTNNVCAARCQTQDTCALTEVCSAATHSCIPAHTISNPCGTGVFGDNPTVVNLDGSVGLDGGGGMDVPIRMRDASSEDHAQPPPEDAGTLDAALPDGAVLPDAAMSDAATTDAATPDGSIPDAAPTPDGAVPDASRPDAALPDASRPDAAGPPDSGPPPCNGTDSHEPNNTPQSASALMGTTASGVLCGPDQDWFAITSSAGDGVTVSVTLMDDAPLQLSLTDGNGVPFAMGSQTGPRAWSLFAGMVPGRTFLQLSAFSVVNVAYSVSVTITPVNMCPPDAFEPNPRQQGAPVITGPVAASICRMDEDWFSFDLQAPNTQIILDMVPSPSSGDLDVTLFSPNGMEVGISQLPQGNAEHIDVSMLPAGRYAVHVYPFNNAIGTYTLTVQQRMQGGSCMDDAFEDNDSLQTASGALQVGSPMPLQGQVCPNDADVFRLIVPMDGPLSVDFVAIGGPVQIQVLNSAGNMLASDVSDGSGMGLTQLNVQGVRGTTLFVRLDGLMTPVDGTQYFLSASMGAACGMDAFEPNNSQFQPMQLNPPSLSAVTCAGDEDWFFTFGNPGENVVATLRFNGPPSAAALEIWDLGPMGGFPVAFGQPVPGGVQAQWQDTQGALLIRITSNAMQSVPYTLTVNRNGTMMCIQDPFEPNDVQPLATRYTAPVNGNICMGDRDIFFVDVMNPNAAISVQLQPQMTMGELGVNVTDPSGNQVASGTTFFGQPVNLVAPVGQPGRYLVTVFGASGMTPVPGTGGYFLNVTVMGMMGCQDDMFEENDTRQAATGFASATVQFQAVLCPNDRDFYSLPVNPGDSLTVSISYTGNQRIRLTLFTPQGQQLGDSNTGSGNETITLTMIPGSSVVARVQGPPMGTQGRDYFFDSSTGAQSCPGDTGEPNDDFFQATPVAPMGTVSAVMCGAQDVDFYQFDGFPMGTVQITLLGGASFTLPLDFLIFDFMGNQVADTFGQMGPVRIASAVITQPGPYFVEVVNSAGMDVQTQYTLVFSQTMGMTCVDDSAEPNNTASQAALRNTNVDISGIACPANLDFYAFDLRANINETITLSNAGQPDGLFELLGTNGTTVLAQGFANFLPITFRPPTTGRYFVRITYGMAPPQGGAYVLRVTP